MKILPASLLLFSAIHLYAQPKGTYAQDVKDLQTSTLKHPENELLNNIDQNFSHSLPF